MINESGNFMSILSLSFFTVLSICSALVSGPLYSKSKHFNSNRPNLTHKTQTKQIRASPMKSPGVSAFRKCRAALAHARTHAVRLASDIPDGWQCRPIAGALASYVVLLTFYGKADRRALRAADRQLRGVRGGRQRVFSRPPSVVTHVTISDNDF